MLDNISLHNIFFLDIETVPAFPDFTSAPEAEQKLWMKKAGTLPAIKDEEPENNYKRAGIYAEFGKIICISAGYFTKENTFRIKSFSGENEKKLLQEFAHAVQQFCSSQGKLLCAHNGKEFDFPFIARRLLINGIALPDVLDIAGKKPWEVQHLDTMELWKFGDYKSYTTLALLAHVFDIPTPKDDIDGSQVGDVYWKERDLQRIVEYCQKDVLTIAQIILKFKGEEIFGPGQIEYA